MKMKVEASKRMMQMNMKAGVSNHNRPLNSQHVKVSHLIDQPPPQFSTHHGVSFDQPSPYYDSYQYPTQAGDYVESFLNYSFYYGDTTVAWNTVACNLFINKLH
ncbi:unnamed protein product [Cuscuta europaea]|uniref:Uncharacterized protein n=1 Tax=Cuscuta europaea TaxID=41803 RepID=A0A9P0YGQ1_CUSEU|nr:unnamed protein product [Cuscuta europaea]